MGKVVHYSNVEIHRRDLIVLRNINFSLEEGELVYLTGKVGCGKSSFLKTIYAEVPIFSGRARALGYRLNAMHVDDIPYLRRQIGIVFQDFQLLQDRSVHDNLLFVLKATGWKDPDRIEDRIRIVLHEVGMNNKSYKFPHELSGGEQQRVVIARALLNEPKLILADEPTGNLDPETGSQIIRRLHAIAAKGTAVIIATHNLSLVEQYPARTIRCANKNFEEILTD